MQTFRVMAAVAALLGLPAAGVFAQTQELPDLTIQSHAAANGQVTAVIANTGRAGASVRTTATLYVYKDGTTHSTVDRSIPALAPGATVTLTFPLPIAAGVYQVMADSRREMTEASETNNRTPNQTFGNAGAVAIPGGGITGGIKPTGPITGPAPGTLKLAIAPDESLRRLVLNRPRLVAEDGSPRPVGAARSPSGIEMIFIENELILTGATPQQAADFAARWNGKILSATDWRDSIGTVYQVRVDTTKAAAVTLNARESGTPFSSEAAFNLLTIAKAAKAQGLRAGINLVATDDGIMEGKTTEGNGKNAFALEYIKAGGTYNVDVENAWKMLKVSGTMTSTNKVRLGILDGGFGVGRSDFIERDVNFSQHMEGTGPNRGNCGKSACPWHGIMVAEAAAGLLDDGHGSAGPAAPSADLLLFDKAGSDLCTAMVRLKQLRDSGAMIMNMSFSGEAPRDDSFWDGTWSDAVEDFEQVTKSMYNQGRLLFASAGNDGKDIDHKNGDGEETAWIWPCENNGVICVGGWAQSTTTMTDPKKWGVQPADKSNYSFTNAGDTVDIYGPWCTEVGDTFDNQGKNVVTMPCGTSFASPFVAGVASLIWYANPNLSNAQVWNLMNKHAITGGSIRRVHAAGAVREALMLTGKKFAPWAQITVQEGKSYNQGQTLSLTHTDFDIEDGAACCASKWYVDGKEVASAGINAQAPQLKMAGLSVGSHMLKIIVTDKDGMGNFNQQVFNVTNAKPVVKVEVMSSDIYVGLPYEFRAVITDDASMFAVGGDACNAVQWSVATNDMTPATPKGCTVTLRFSKPGTHILKADYKDSLGEPGSGTATFTVKALAKIGVAITKPSANNGFNSGEPINYVSEVVNGTHMANVSWTLTDTVTKVTRPIPLKIGKDKTFTFQSIFPEYAYSTSGRSYVLTATAKDKNGDTASHSVPLHQMAFIH